MKCQEEYCQKDCLVNLECLIEKLKHIDNNVEFTSVMVCNINMFYHNSLWSHIPQLLGYNQLHNSFENKIDSVNVIKILSNLLTNSLIKINEEEDNSESNNYREHKIKVSIYFI